MATLAPPRRKRCCPAWRTTASQRPPSTSALELTGISGWLRRGRASSTNPLERINKEIKRRSRVVGILPNPAAMIRFVGAVLTDIHDE